MPESAKILTNVNNFNDVQKSLQELEKKINELLNSVNSSAESEVSDKDGKTGDTKITRNADASYTFEIRTEEGWKTPAMGQSLITFKDKPAQASKHKKESISDLETDDTTKGTSNAAKNIFDESTGEFSIKHLTENQTGGLMKPDYDSGWIDVDANGTTGSGGTLTHNLGEYPQLVQAWFVPDADYNSGDPANIFLLSLNVGMRHQDNWAGVSAMFTKNTMQYWLYRYVYIVYGVYNDPMANGWDKFEEGYMRVFLWK